MGIKYRGTSYEDWYKAHYGKSLNATNGVSAYSAGEASDDYAPVKTEGMSDSDFEIGQRLYDSYVQGQRYKSEYEQALSDAEKTRDSEKREADILRQRLEKYLPQQLALQGLSGSGISEDAYLKLNNRYQSSIDSANARYGSTVSDYKTAYENQKHSLWQSTTDGVNSVADNEKALQSSSYNEAYAALDPSALTSSEDVDKILSDYKDSLSDTQYANLSRYASTVKDSIAELQAEKAKAPGYKATLTDHDSLNGGEDLTISINGKNYIIESSGEASNAKALSYAQSNIEDGEAFAYDGSLYVYSGGMLYGLKSKSNSNKNRAVYNTVRHYLLHGEVIKATA